MKGMVARARRELGPGRARAWWAIAALCLFLLLALIAVDVMHRLFYTHGMFPRLRHWRFNSDADQSISEMVGYVQSLIAHGGRCQIVCVRGGVRHESSDTDVHD